MTKYNYIGDDALDTQTIINMVNDCGRGFKNIIQAHRHKELFDFILRKTEFLPKDSKLVERVYCVIHGITTLPTCSCERHAKLTFRGTLKKGYCKHCRYCVFSDPDVVQKRDQTCINRFGVKYYNQTEESKLRHKDAYRKHYGVNHVSELDWFKKLLSDKYNNKSEEEKKQINDKRIKTNQERFNADYFQETYEWKYKSIETCNLKFGTDYASQNKEIAAKISISLCSKSDDEWQEILDKRRTTNLERYDVESYSQTDEFKQKCIETCHNRYGVDHYSQTKECWDKIKETCNLKYGYDFYQQSPEYYANRTWKYTNPKHPDMTFGSSWEFIVYDFLLENHIVFEYQPPVSLPYEYKETHHTYHPDFRIGDKIVEVKGDNFFRINPETDKEEMFCPYRDEDWSDEKYEWMCGLYEAKHQCMIANNIIILRREQIENLDSVFNI